MVFHLQFSGDIVVSPKTSHKLITKKNGSNATVSNAYPDSTVDIWDQNIINEYVISYKFNSGLDYTLQNMLPQVRFEVKDKAERITSEIFKGVISDTLFNFMPGPYLQPPSGVSHFEYLSNLSNSCLGC